MKKYISVLGLFVLLGMVFSCSSSDTSEAPVVDPPVEADTFIRGADISFLPEIESAGVILYNNAKAEGMLTTLKKCWLQYHPNSFVERPCQWTFWVD